MSDSVHMTVKQAVRKSGFNYGSAKFKQYVFENNISLLAKKIALKKDIKNKRLTDKFLKNANST